MNSDLGALVTESLMQSQEAQKVKNWELAWTFLAEAHILSQSHPWLHTMVHWKMLGLGFRQFDLREVRGQVFRLLLAAPGSAIGKYPTGNTGRSNVSAFLEMPIPEHLRVKLAKVSKNSLGKMR